MSSAEGTLLPPAAPVAAAGVVPEAAALPRRRLFRKYALLFVGLVGATLLITSGFDFWFSYQENKAALIRLQQEKAQAAAERIEGFVAEIERQIGWTTHAQWAAAPLDQRRQDYFRLLRQVPAITELTQLDGEGREQLKVSRLSMDVIGGQADFSQSPAFLGAKADRVWFSPVYFRKQSEPYMTVAAANDGKNAGVTLAEINLKLIWDVITGLKIGQGGYAYVVDGQGRLIAHPDISLVLRDTDLSRLPQVAGALVATPGPRGGRADIAATAQGIAGEPVLTAHAPIVPLAWLVFVEVPLKEAFAPLYGAAIRTGLLLVFGLGAATLVALVLARRMTGPIRAIAAGAERFGAGELDRRIDIKTGDELEALAGQFNRMATDLQKSYAELERKVEERTAELSEALDQQTATAEVLQVINSSPGDLAPVFEAVLEKALTLCGAAFGQLNTYDGERFRTVVTRGVPPAFAEFREKNPPAYGPGTASERILSGDRVIHIADLKEEDAYRAGEPNRLALVDLGGARTMLIVALIKDEAVLGTIMVYRQEVRPFSDKQIALLQNFAAQAVIAMENARLITETREALEQQTATAEVLQVINSSPGDLAPVFDAMLEKATNLCEVAFGFFVHTPDGESFYDVAHRGFAGHLEPIRSVPGMALARIVSGEPVVQIADLAADPLTYADNPARRRLVEAGGARTALWVALRKDEALLGVLVVFRQEVRPFSDREIALLQNFAAQAVIAMENARLIAETREALEQQTATAEVLQVINSSPGDLAPVFDAMLEKAIGLCEAPFGAIRTFDGELFHLVAMQGSDPGAVEAVRQRGSVRPSGPFALLARGDPVVHVADSRDLEDYRIDAAARERIELNGIRTWLAVALQKEGVVLGALLVWRQEVHPFNDKQIALLQNFAAQAVIAMENARLITETREALEQQTATAEVLQVINSSPGDLAPVFDAILEKAHGLCGIARGALALYDGEYFKGVAIRGYPESLADVIRRPYRGNIAHQRLLDGERYVHIPDVSAWSSSLSDPVSIAFRGTGLGTTLMIPMRKDNKLLGQIVAVRQEVRPFSDKQIALLQNFAAQAVIAMENARLITETREALEQQTATAEVLQVINSSPGDLAPVFDAMLDKAMRLCDAAFGSLWTYGGDRFRPVAYLGVPERYAEYLRHEVPEAGPGTGRARLLAGEGLVQIVDLADEEPYRNGEPHRLALVDLGGARTALLVALRKEATVIGFIMIYRQEVRPFSDKQIALLQNFAAQAVIAMENARLLTETRERTRDLQESLEYQTATSDVLKVISGSAFELQPVLDTVVATAVRLCRADHAGIYRNENGVYRWVAGYAQSPEYERVERAAAIRPGVGTVVGRTALEGRIVQIMDAMTDPLYEAKEDARIGNSHTLLGVPLMREGLPIGVIGLSRTRVEPFTDKQIALLQNFADQAVIAIENARLLGELRDRTDDLARSVEELKVLGEVGQAVSSTLDLHSVLVTILNRSMALADADAGVIFRYSRAERAFRFVEAVGWDEALVEQVRDLNVGESMTALGDAIANRAPLQIPDLQRRPSNPLRDSALAAGFRSVLIVPLVGADRIMGATILQRRAVGEFPEATIRLMQALASQSVLAIQNARLFREIADKSEQLAQASQHKSQFLANMSHELRTPLNAILGYTELMADGIYGELAPRAAGVLDRVQNNGRHLLALINDVLDLAKIEAGQLAMTLEDYAMPDVVQSVVSATEGLANTKGLRFTADIAPGLPPGRGDARRLSQVLLNLVGNAVKFTDAGEVAIGAMAENGNFVLTVRDTGPGIAAADQGKIFEEFQQIDNSNTRKKGGTGLGLAISKRMVEMQGGTISVDSELGHGATFRVTLPVRVEEVPVELLGAAQ